MNIQLAVTMIDGSLAPVAQREQWLEMYKYQKNPTIPDRWDLLSSSADDEGAALIIKDDGERIELVGESSTNITQACYIAARIGWTSCRIVEAPSQDVYRIFVERLNIELEEPAPADPFGADTFTLEDDDESGMGATATQPNGQDVHNHEAPLVFDLEHEEAGTLPSAPMHSAEKDTIRDIEVLTIRANDAEMNVDRLEDALLKSQTEVQQLRQQLANQQRQDTSDNASSINIKSPMIITVLERHIADLLSEHIGKQVPLVNELEALGFNCKVSVALSSSATDTHS